MNSKFIPNRFGQKTVLCAITTAALAVGANAPAAWGNGGVPRGIPCPDGCISLAMLMAPAGFFGAWELVLLLVTALIIVPTLWALVDCANHETSAGGMKAGWILVILLSGLVGAALYYFVRKRPRDAALRQGLTEGVEGYRDAAPIAGPTRPPPLPAATNRPPPTT